MYQFVVLQLFGVDAVWVVDGSIDLADTDAFGTKPVKVPHGVKTHVTKALSKAKHSKSLNTLRLKVANSNEKFT